MAKRYNRLQIQTVNAKRPKIEVEPHANGVSVHVNNSFKVESSVSSKYIVKIPNLSTFDDDEDDDMLVYASSQLEQKAERKHTFAVPQPIQGQAPGMSESFSAFAVGAECKTSTQMFVNHGNARNNVPEPKIDITGWDDDDDLLLSQFDMDAKLAQLEKQKEKRIAANNAQPTISKVVQAPVQQAEFKVRGQVAAHRHDAIMDSSVILPSQMTVSDEARSNMQQRRHRANELKIQFLENHMKQLNERLKKAETTAGVAEQNTTVREREIVSLKYDLKNANSTLERLRKDKLKDSEKINKEWTERMTELEKKLKVTQVELEHKNAEIMNVKMKRSSANAKQMQEAEEARIKASDIYGMCQQYYALPETPMTVNSHVFKEIDEKYVLKKEICVKQYDSLTMGLSKLFVSGTAELNIMRQAIPTIKTVLKHIYRFALKLNKTNPVEYQLVPSAEVKHLAATIHQNRPLILCDVHPHGQPSIYDSCENVRDEKILVARRCLAVIAEMCRSKSFVTVILNDEMNFLKKLTLIVQIIGSSVSTLSTKTYQNTTFNSNNFSG